jgi:hypothetical protein
MGDVIVWVFGIGYRFAAEPVVAVAAEPVESSALVTAPMWPAPTA